MKILFCALAIIHHSYYILAEDVRLLDLEPNDAQNIIESKDTTLKYAPKVDSNVPAVRYLGNEPHHVLEDIYLANQYHGQDGLGGYLYGYAVPDIAKTEKKKAGGDLTGAYNYIAGNGQEIKVQYWDNGNGFHQIDNVPKILPKQIDDTPEVKAAKDEHQRIWNEQAERNSHPVVDPNAQFQQPYQQTPQYAQAQQLVKQYQQQKQQYPNPGQSVFYQGGHEGQYQGQPSNINQYQQPGGQFAGKAQGPGVSGQYSGNQPGSGSTQGGVQHTSGQYSGSQPSNINQYQQPGGQFVGKTQGQTGQYSGTQAGQSAVGQPSNINKYQQPGGQFVGTAQGPAVSGQYSGNQPGSGQTGQYSGNQPTVGQPAGSQVGSQYLGGQPGGQSTPGKYSGSGGYNQPQGSGQIYGQASGQYSGSQSAASQQYSSSQKSSGSYSQEDQGDQGEWKYNPSEEEKGPPKGFFYNFDYPVGIIVQKDGGGLKDIYSSNKANFEKQLQAGSSDRSARSSTGYLVV